MWATVGRAGGAECGCRAQGTAQTSGVLEYRCVQKDWVHGQAPLGGGTTTGQSSRGLLRSLLALPLAIRMGQWPPLPVQAAALPRQTYSSPDGACYVSVPPDWSLVEVCSPARVREQCEATGRRVITAARSPDGRALATLTVDLGAYGKKLTDFASLQTISTDMLAFFEGSTLSEASEVASRRGSLSAPNYYVLRFEEGREAGRSEQAVKLTVRQSRLYTLTLQAEAPSPALRAELEGILSSFDAFPVSSLRGGLLSSAAPALLRPPPLETAMRLRGGLQRLAAALRATPIVLLCPARAASLNPAPPPRPRPLASFATRQRTAQGLTARGLTALAAVAVLLHASPVAANGYDEALRLCPDERVACVSSLDAGHFLEPWEYDGTLARAVLAVAGAAAAEGGVVEQDDSSAAGTALRVRFPRDDLAVFWFPSNDALVNFRSERVDGSLWDRSANKLRLDRMRKALSYAPAPMVKNRRALPSERLPDGSFQLEEERPYKRRDGRFYGEQGGGEPTGLTSLASPEAVRRLLFPFGRLGEHASPAQALYDDLSELANLPAR